jgi:hypothetical protein
MSVFHMSQWGGDDSQGRTRLQLALDPGLLALGAVLLMCAPVFPGLSRLVVLPALLLAPGNAFLRLLGHTADSRVITLGVPVSIVLIVCSAMILNATHVRLGPVSLGLMLGVLTALFLAGAYGREMLADRSGSHRRRPPDDWDLDDDDADIAERR